jgi:hypothetical protein
MRPRREGDREAVVGWPGMSAECGDCLWWSKAAYESMGADCELACGYCRRYPPYVVLDEEGGDGHGGPLMAHPMVYAGDEACGEYRWAR